MLTLRSNSEELLIHFARREAELRRELACAMAEARVQACAAASARAEAKDLRAELQALMSGYSSMKVSAGTPVVHHHLVGANQVWDVHAGALAAEIGGTAPTIYDPTGLGKSTGCLTRQGSVDSSQTLDHTIRPFTAQVMP